MSNYVSSKEHGMMNLEAISRIELNGNKVMPFFTDFTARDNWEYPSAETAKEAFAQIIDAGHFHKLDENHYLNLSTIVRVELRKKTVNIYYTDMTARYNPDFESEAAAADFYNALAETRRFVTSEGKDLVNLDNIARVELKEEKVMFFAVAASARTNWTFDGAAEAEEAYKKLLEKISAKAIKA